MYITQISKNVDRIRKTNEQSDNLFNRPSFKMMNF